MLQMRVAQFYGSGLGGRLIDPARFPKEIKRFLTEEERLISSMAHTFDLLVEVGCMHGRYLDWSAARGMRYLGLDVVQSYIDEGKARVSQCGLDADHYQFICGAAEQLWSFLKPYCCGLPRNRILLLFPFNSLGNMQRLQPVVRALKLADLPFLVSSYVTSSQATRIRTVYYNKCGYESLQHSEDRRGVCFYSPQGFRSFAYHPSYVTKAFKEYGISVDAIFFGGIGVGYKTVNI
jgi:hypothetical protein